ncbi:MAG TPA: hypothetical protein VHG29_09745 [Novosphingobium sp.]|nr:hypothetical protein [Novosphingobium sp.]
MEQLRIEGLPEDALAAAAEFHAEWLGRATAALEASAPPLAGEGLVIILSPADHTHRGWRLAAVQSLARQFAPHRVNAVASGDDAAIRAAIAYLECAKGVTGQYLALDGAGAAEVIRSVP